MTILDNLSEVRRLRLPLPFELKHINLHLVRLEQGWMLIDCGLGTDISLQVLTSALAEAGVGWSEIRQVLITHTHPDHVGLATTVLERTGARLLMHGIEADLLATIAANHDRPHWLDQVLREGGVPPDAEATIHAAFVQFRKNFRKLDPDWRLQGGEKIPTALGDLEVIWTPGHSPGHICLYGKERRLLISGDHILPDITPNIGWLPEKDTLADYLHSLDLAASLDADWILPSHGEPFQGHREWVQATKAHHAERCDRILEGVAGSPRTAQDLVSHLWTYTLSPFNHRFAVFEVLAHAVYLANRGRLVSLKENGVTRWALPG